MYTTLPIFIKNEQKQKQHTVDEFTTEGLLSKCEDALFSETTTEK